MRKNLVKRGDLFVEINRELKRSGSHWDLYTLVARHRLLPSQELSWNAIAVLIYSMTHIYVTGEHIRKRFTKDGCFIPRKEFKL